MSKVEIDPLCPRRIQPDFATRNGMLPSASFQSDLARLINTIARYRGKQYGRFGGDVANLSDTSLSANKIWRFAGVIGPVGRTMVARVTMAPAKQVTSTNNPYVTLTVYDLNGNVVAGGTAGRGRGHFGYFYNASPQEVPSEWGELTVAVDVSALRTTRFRAVLEAHEEARMIGATVYEETALPDTDEGYVNQAFSVGQPILDEDRQKIQDLAVAIYKYGLGPVFAYSSSTDAGAPTRDVTSYRTVNGVFTSTLSDTPGYRVDLRYCARKTVSTVPVKIECYAAMPTGTGTVRVVDSAGNVYATFSVTGAAAWQTPQTANLPADQRMYFIEHAGDGVNSITTYAVTCYRYS